jgi:hypothetical protein
VSHEAPHRVNFFVKQFVLSWTDSEELSSCNPNAVAASELSWTECKAKAKYKPSNFNDLPDLWFPKLQEIPNSRHEAAGSSMNANADDSPHYARAPGDRM